MSEALEQKSAQQRSGQKEPESEVDIDIRALFLMLWRRKMVIISIMLLGVALASVAITFIQARYTARTLLILENKAGQTAGLNQLSDIIGTIKLDTSFVLNELEVFKSRSLARKVVERLNLMTDPEFNVRFRYAESSTAMDDAAVDGGNFKTLSVYGAELKNLPPEVYNREMAEVISEFLEGLSVQSVSGSFAIQLRYTSVDPHKAALIANTIADAYIEQRLEEKFQAAQKVANWLDQRLSSLRTQVRESEAAVEDYKARFNLEEGTRTVISAEQLSLLNSQLVQAKAQKAEAQARLEQVLDNKAKKESQDETAEFLNSALIDRLKLNKITLEAELNELSSRYGPRHPEILTLKAEIREIQRTIDLEIQNAAKSIESEVLFADARVAALEEGLLELRGQRQEDNEAMIKLRELQREADSTRLIFDTFLQTYKRSDEQEKLQEAEARILSYAIVPTIPTYPNKTLILSLSAAISLFIGLAIAFLIEKLDNTYRSANQLENTLGYPCYALIPEVAKMTQQELTKYILSKPSSTVAESVRTLRMVLNLRAKKAGKKPKVVTITSSFPGEGKTTLSLWLGRLAAKSGEKVIVIDGDLRRPNIHRSVSQSNDATLVEYLTGQMELDEVIQKDELSGLHMIYGRSVPNSALDLVTSEKMRKLVESLKQVYDLVILDSPACLAVSDARVLATLSDQTLYAIAWDDTPREVVASGVKQFSDMDYNDLALVLTNVDVKRHVRYGYGDTVYYYGRYNEYHSN